ncbi:hypothetical protein D1872_286410 [compost metagenome]
MYENCSFELNDHLSIDCLINAKLGAKNRTVEAPIPSETHKEMRVLPDAQAAIIFPLSTVLKPLIAESIIGN